MSRVNTNNEEELSKPLELMKASSRK